MSMLQVLVSAGDGPLTHGELTMRVGIKKYLTIGNLKLWGLAKPRILYNS